MILITTVPLESLWLWSLVVLEMDLLALAAEDRDFIMDMAAISCMS